MLICLEMTAGFWGTILPLFSPSSYIMLRFNTNYFSNFQVMTYLEDSEWVKVTLSRLLKGVDFPGGTVVKNLPASAGDNRDVGLIPGSGRPPGVGNGNPLQYSCLVNSLDRRAWWAPVHGVTKSWTQLSTHTQRFREKETGKIYCCLLYRVVLNEDSEWWWLRRKTSFRDLVTGLKYVFRIQYINTASSLTPMGIY